MCTSHPGNKVSARVTVSSYCTFKLSAPGNCFISLTASIKSAPVGSLAVVHYAYIMPYRWWIARGCTRRMSVAVDALWGASWSSTMWHQSSCKPRMWRWLPACCPSSVPPRHRASVRCWWPSWQLPRWVRSGRYNCELRTLIWELIDLCICIALRSIVIVDKANCFAIGSTADVTVSKSSYL